MLPDKLQSQTFKMDDEKLIELVRENGAIYDVAHKKYMDINYKTEIWREIGQDLGVSGKYLTRAFGM